MTVITDDIKKITKKMLKRKSSFASGKFRTRTHKISYQISVKDLKK